MADDQTKELTKDEQAKKYIPMSSAGLMLVVLGLFVLDGPVQLLLMVVGAAACLFAAINLIRISKLEA